MTADRRLIDRARAGDKEAFCRLYNGQKDGMYRYALYKLGNREDAEDAVQECVLDAYRQIGSLRSSEAFKTWLYRILAASCNRVIRKNVRQREKIGEMQQQMSVRQDERGKAEFTESAELTQALEQLDDKARDIVLLSIVGGFTSVETGELVGIRPGSVRSQLSRSLRKMREYLERT